MPGSIATLVTCSYTLASISRSRLSLPKITPGTRILPNGLMRHWKSDSRSSRARSMANPLLKTLHVHYALGEPAAFRLLRDLQRGISRAFHFDGWVMACCLQSFTPYFRSETPPLQMHLETAEQHVA